MPTPDELRRILERYIRHMCESDADGIMQLYADDATVEDPVGANPIRGREALHAFYTAAVPQLMVEITGPIRVAGLECAMPLVAEVTMESGKSYIDVIDIMRFNEQGKIVSMRAYWNPAEMRPQR
jgi:steroid delta-isomerase